MRGAAVCSWALWIGLASAGRCETTSAPSPTTAAVSSDEAKASGDNDQPAAKVAEPESSQERVEKVDPAAGPKQQIRVDLKICELSLTRMRRLGIDFSELRLGPAAPDRSKTTGGAAEKKLAVFTSVDSDGAASVVAMLRREKVLTVMLLTSPTEIIADGRTAYFIRGNDPLAPMTQTKGPQGSSGPRRPGAQVELTGNLLGADRIRLNVRAKLLEEDPSVSITLNGRKLPGYRTQEMDFPIEMELGKTAMIGGLIQANMEVVVDPKTRQKSTVRDTTQMLVLIKPELVDAPAK